MHPNFGRFLTVSLASLVTTAAAQACSFPQDWTVVTGAGGDQLAYRFETTPVAIAQPVTLGYKICLADRSLVTASTLDARMPKHQHGLNYYPMVHGFGEGSFDASNILFHMPGDWEIAITANPDTTPIRFVIDLELK